MNFYENYFVMYLKADTETRKASKQHWLKCHSENLKSKDERMICFSAQILAQYALADEIIATKTAQ